jgi:hypothetical protein
MRRRWREPAAIAAEIDRIRSLRLDALRRQWRLMFGRVPPAGLSKDLLGRMIAARLQERAFGSLDRDSLRFLENLPTPAPVTSPAQTRDRTRSRVSRPAPHRHDRPRRLRLATSQRSHAPSPARPGVGRASLPSKEPATAPSPSANQPPLSMVAGVGAGR